ncbi:Gaa1-like protein [Russula vinacea]|nr:Gaa1-like protein [Russula vinacea]
MSTSGQARAPANGWRDRIKSVLMSRDTASRIRKRRMIVARAWRHLNVLRLGLLLAGYLWLFVLPLSQLGIDTYIDENALQPSQVNTYWNWVDVHRADKFLEDVSSMRDRNLSSTERATFFAAEFAKFGIPSSTQRYSIQTSFGTLNGTNAYAVFSAPRTSGTEAMIISASWKSLTGGDNLRGVSTVLSLAAFLKEYSHWSKDIVFVISDSHLDGMHAWLSAYHRPSNTDLDVEPLSITSGVVWTALNIDYPGHSFSHLGVFREGLNGRTISQHTGNVPVLLYDHHEPFEFPGREEIRNFYPSWLPSWIWERGSVLEYGYRAKNILRHSAYQARGKASGVHGLFHQYRIDAITLFAVPSNGPHGFLALGRIVESTLRTMSNLLERLHASFFLYIMSTPSSFLKIGTYLPSAVLIAAALMFGGLQEWGKNADIVTASRKKWVPRRRDLLGAFVVAAVSHLYAYLRFVGSQFLPRRSPCGALGVPLSLASPSNSLPSRGLKCAFYTTLALGWLAFDGEVKQMIRDWQVLGVWFSPLVCLVYVPFVLQAGIVSSLSP